MWITLLIFFGICWTFILSTRDYICWKYVFGIRRKIWRFGIANISFSNQSDIKFEKKKKKQPQIFKRNDWRWRPLSWEERSFKKQMDRGGSVWTGQSTRAGAGKVGEAPEDLHIRARASEWPQSGENWALTVGWLWREIQAQVSTSCWTSVEARVVDLQWWWSLPYTNSMAPTEPNLDSRS